MNQPADDRVAVRFGPPAADEAVLIEGDASACGRPVARFRLAPALAAHAPGCACCVPRGPAAQALDRFDALEHTWWTKAHPHEQEKLYLTLTFL